MSVQTGLITVEEFLKLPEPKEGHLELHHGEVILMPPPKWGHQRIQRRILALLMQVAGEGVAQIEMAFRPPPEHEVWQADIGFVSSARDAATGDDEYLMGPPELVVEVLSPSNTVNEIDEKMAVCTDNGGISFWVVDPKRQRVSVTEGDVTRRYGIGSAISCEALTGTINVSEIFV